MYKHLARSVAARPWMTVAGWLAIISVSAFIALWGFGTPLFERLNTGIPDAAPSESWQGQQIINQEQFKDYAVMCYIEGVDFSKERQAYAKNAKEIEKLRQAAQDKGDAAMTKKNKAESEAQPALSLKAQAEAEAARALSLKSQAEALGARAQAIGAQARQVASQALAAKARAEGIGAQAQAVGGRAQSLGAQAQSSASQAKNLGAQAQAAGVGAGKLGAQAQAAAAQAQAAAAAGNLAAAAQYQAQANELAARAQALKTQAEQLGAQASAAGAQAKTLGAQAQTLATQASQLGAQATTIGAQAQALGDRAQGLAGQAQRLGGQAQAVGREAQAAGDNAQAIGEQAKAAGDLAQAIGQEAKDIGEEAKKLGDKAKALAEPDAPVSKAIAGASKSTLDMIKKMPQYISVGSPFLQANAMLSAKARDLTSPNGQAFTTLAVFNFDKNGAASFDPGQVKYREKVEKALRDLGPKITKEVRKIPGYEKTTVTAHVTDEAILLESGIGHLKRDLVIAESIGIPLSFLIMVLVFGGVLAALMPLSGALVSITTSLAVMLGMTYLAEQQSFSLNVISVMGLSLSIDYGLLIVSRYREELLRLKRLGPSHYEQRLGDVKRARVRHKLEKVNPRYLRAMEITLATAGRTVFFSALIVAISITGMLFFRPSLLKSLGVAGLSVVLVAVTCAITLIPALIFLAKDRMERPSRLWRVPGFKQLHHVMGERSLNHADDADEPGGEAEPGHGKHRQPDPATAAVAAASAESAGTTQVSKTDKISAIGAALGDPTLKRGLFSWIAYVVSRHPWKFFLASTALLITLAIPVGNLQLRNSMLELLPLQDPQRHVLQEMGKIPLAGIPSVQIVAQTANLKAADEWAASSLKKIEGIKSLTPARELGTKHVLMGVKTTNPDKGALEVEAVVQKIRDQHSTADFKYYVVGQAANQMDFVQALREGLPYALIVVIVATLALLFFMTGSVLMPLQALVLNTFSLLATLGLTTWIFQGGHLTWLLGFEKLGGVESYIVVLLFCFGFGLSMDYEVFLISRVKEVWDATGDNNMAVQAGLQRSGRIITSAALILVFVFFTFVTGKMIVLKQLGVMMATAVLIDATLVRMLLVPSVMALFGRANWWAPRWLRHFHTWVMVKFEGTHHVESQKAQV